MTQFRQSRPKLALTALLFGGWSLIVGFMGYVSAHADGLWPYLALSLFVPLALAGALAAANAALSWWHPATLTATATGVTYKNWRDERRFAWDTIEGFLVLSPEARLRSPGMQLKHGQRRFVSFGRNWEREPGAIVEQLGASMPVTAP
jgi:hypothetical protein